jgi:hypothetical protein
MRLNILPTELVEHIASHLDLPSFRSFRLVCQSLQQQSAHHFRERFFRKRTITWAIESFQTALSVTSHPEFGNALQDLHVDATPRHSIRLWKMKTQLQDNNIFFSNLTVEDERDAKESADAQAKKWNETRFDQKVLIKMFERIRVLKSITFEYEGMEARYGKFGRRYCETSQNEMSRPFVSSMNAIVASGITVQNIYMDKEKKHGAVSIGRLESLSPALSKFDAVFENLHILNLNLRDWRHPEEGFEPLIQHVPFVVRFLAKCRNIKSLEISCYSSLDDDIFSDMANHCAFSHLENCKLNLFRVYAATDLLTFLGRSQSTLRSLSLSHIVLRDDHADWSEVMLRMADKLNCLERLELHALFTRIGNNVAFPAIARGCYPVPRVRSMTVTIPDLQETLKKRALNLGIHEAGPAWHVAAVAYPFVGLRT